MVHDRVLSCETYSFSHCADSSPVSDHLPPPSLSQHLPLSYLASTNPLPCTQESSQANITVYAPETEPTQQSLAARQKWRSSDGDAATSQGDAITKIDETILLGKKSPKPSTAGGAGATVATKGETMDTVSDAGYGIDDSRFPPAEVKSKLDKKLLLTSKQNCGESSSLSKSRLWQKEPRTRHGEHSLESIVEDSQPDSEVLTNTVLPGLKKPTVMSLAGNRGEVMGPFSVETNHSLPETDPSVLVPSTLTPRSQEKPLPDSSFISTLFKGKRKKRELADSSSQESQRESKRRHVEDDHRRGRVEKEQQSMGDVAATGASLFSGSQTLRSRGRVKQLESCVVGEGVGSETMEIGTNRLLDSAVTVHSKTCRPASEEKHMPKDETTLVATSTTVGKSASLSTPKTPKKRQREEDSSTSPFLSTRKHRKVEVSPAKEDDANVMTNTSALGCGSDGATLTDNPATLSCTQHTQNTSKLAAGTGLVTPFTCLTFPVGVVCSTGGKRTKVSTSTNDDIWNDDNGDGMMFGRGGDEGEDPLGLQEPPRRNYKPVCTEDGFILARCKPKLQVGR